LNVVTGVKKLVDEKVKKIIFFIFETSEDSYFKEFIFVNILTFQRFIFINLKIFDNLF